MSEEAACLALTFCTGESLIMNKFRTAQGLSRVPCRGQARFRVQPEKLRQLRMVGDGPKASCQRGCDVSIYVSCRRYETSFHQYHDTTPVITYQAPASYVCI